MNTDLPTEPNSDGWISFHRVQRRGFTLGEHCQFRLPEDSWDDRSTDAAGINLYPSELRVAGDSGRLALWRSRASG